jgi:hypothetical protein
MLVHGMPYRRVRSDPAGDGRIKIGSRRNLLFMAFSVAGDGKHVFLSRLCVLLLSGSLPPAALN